MSDTDRQKYSQTLLHSLTRIELYLVSSFGEWRIIITERKWKKINNTGHYTGVSNRIAGGK